MKRKCRDTNVNAFPLLDQPEAGHQERSRALGAVEHIYDTCGMMGLCPECRRKGIVELRDGCQRHYVAGTVRGVADGE